MRRHILWVAPMLILVGILIGLLSATAAPRKYDRSRWPHWTVTECLDTRARVLMRDHRGHNGGTEHNLLWRDGGCELAFGHWADPYTGADVHNPTKLEVDHLVPLENAHRSGGDGWPVSRRRQYANALEYRWHLVAVTPAENSRKGSRGPEKYRPPNERFWCQYGSAWATIKFVWGLSASQEEREAVREMVKAC